MRPSSIALLLSAVTFSPLTQAQNCDAALVKDHVSYEGDDVQRMTHSFLLDEKTFSEKSKKGNALTPYGTADYGEFQKRTEAKRLATATAIGRDQWQTYGRWYLSDNARNAYVSCLEAARLTRPGIFLRVSAADARVVQLNVICKRGNQDPTEFPLIFGKPIGGTIVGNPPQKVSCGEGGSTTIQVERTKNEPLRVVVTSGTDYSDSLIVPRYIRILASPSSVPIDSRVVEAYCPYGGGKEVAITLRPSKVGWQLDPEATEFVPIKRYDYGGNVREESNIFMVKRAPDLAQGKVVCWPATRKGAVVQGMISSVQRGIAFAAVEE